MIKKLLCKIGCHNWKALADMCRQCAYCKKIQLLKFYSNRTQEWIDKNDRAN